MQLRHHGFTLSALLVMGSGFAQSQDDPGRSPTHRSRASGPGAPDGSSGGGHGGGSQGKPAKFPSEFRTVDGHGNNVSNPDRGAAGTPLRRLLMSDYSDGHQAPAGSKRPGAREISNGIADQGGSIPNAAGASDYLWMWGQFLDHDLVETPIAAPEEPFDIPVPLGDPWFDPTSMGGMTIPLDRSGYEVVHGVREQVNEITAYIDASNVYGSDSERAQGLRTLDGTGQLETSAGSLLPFNLSGLPNAPSPDPSFFLAGDIRANEQVALTAMHTLFVREHNHWARRLGRRNPGLDGEEIYQYARAIVAAEMQAITYREFLPLLLGPGALLPETGYRAHADASIANVFAGAAFRVGHTMLTSQLLRLNGDGTTHPSGNLPLSEAFFRPDQILSIGIDPYLRGLAFQEAQAVDPFIIDALRNFLFGDPGFGGFDLASLNIQRGRDHGLPSYVKIRKAVGGSKVQDFSDISSDPEIRDRLAATYGSVQDVDAWVGLLAEDSEGAAMVGPTLRTLLADQFVRLRDGDRFWYRTYLPAPWVEFVEDQTLARIIRRNTGIGSELPDDVFRVPL